MPDPKSASKHKVEVPQNMDYHPALEQSRSTHHQPCAACKLLRRRCDGNCVLAPYFPCEEIDKFAGVHKVFGASNVIKMIKMLEENKREDAVKAIVYEAKARLRDPVYGSTGAIFHLQKMVQELQVQLESIRVQTLEMQEQRDNLMNILMNDVHNLDVVSSNIVNDEPTFDGGSFSLNHDDTFGYDPLQFPLDSDLIF